MVSSRLIPPFGSVDEVLELRVEVYALLPAFATPCEAMSFGPDGDRSVEHMPPPTIQRRSADSRGMQPCAGPCMEAKTLDESREPSCYHLPMRNVLLFLALLLAPAMAWADRPLPEDGVRAILKGPQQYPLVQLGGKIYRLAPGGIIRDEANRKIVHGELPHSAQVLYLADANGEISRIWILTPEEQAGLARAGKK
jgi:hypothetical protein